MMGTTLGYLVGLGLSMFLNVGSLPMMIPVIIIGASLNIWSGIYAFQKIDIPYLNYQKLDILVDYYLKSGNILGPYDIIKKTKLLLSFRINRNVAMGRKKLDKIFKELDQFQAEAIITGFKNEKFMCLPKKSTFVSKLFNKGNRLEIYYRKGVTNDEVILGFIFAAKMQENLNKGLDIKNSINETYVNHTIEAKQTFLKKLYEAGWKTQYLYVPYQRYQYDSTI